MHCASVHSHTHCMCAEPVCSLELGLQRCQQRTNMLLLCGVATEMDQLMQQLGGQQVMAAIHVRPAPSLRMRSLIWPHRAIMCCMYLACTRRRQCFATSSGVMN